MANEDVTINPEYRQIPLTRGKFTFVDAADYDWLMQWKWQYNKGYARNSQRIKGTGKFKNISLHRLLLDAPSNLQVDHINNDKLDNRKSNLRLCNTSRNHMNMPKLNIKKATSKYKGVSWNKIRKKWLVIIQIDSKSKYLGYFDSEIEAALTYNEAAKKNFGEFARLNDLCVPIA